MQADPWRLFIALWPDAASREALQTWSDAQHWPEGARRTRPEHLHLTLHFLGPTDPARVPELASSLPKRIDPITLRLAHLQDWGEGLQVLRPLEYPPALMELQKQIGATLGELGLPVDDRRFRPHVTLGRKGSGLLLQSAPEIHWQCNSLVLARSQKGYHPLWRSS